MKGSLLRRSSLWIALCLVIAFPVCLRAQSSSSPPVSYSLGVQAFNSGNYQEALTQIQSAISERPEDLDYQYLLGLIYSRLKRFDEAELVFSVLLKHEEERFGKAYFDLANIYIQKDREDDALETLRKAAQTDPGRADYEIGLLYMRQKKYKEAVGSFSQAAVKKPELASQAMVQQAVANYYLENYKDARELLRSVLKMDIPKERAEEVRRLLQSIDLAYRKHKPWGRTATVSYHYDSNVFQDPLDQANLAPFPGRVTDEDDSAFLASITGRYNFFQQDPWKLGVAYNHYQLTYGDHSDLSLIAARPSVYALWENKPYFAGLEYMFSHYWVDNESRGDVHSILPRFTMLHGERWRTEAYGGLDWRFYEDAFPDDNKYRIGLTEMYLLREGKAHIRAGYLMDYDDLESDRLGDFVEHHAIVGFLWPVWKDKWFLDISGRYIRRDFDLDRNISLNKEREDDEQDLFIQLSGPVTSDLQLTLLFQQVWNDSNINNNQDVDPFHYRRTLFTCMLTFNY